MPTIVRRQMVGTLCSPFWVPNPPNIKAWNGSGAKLSIKQKAWRRALSRSRSESVNKPSFARSVPHMTNKNYGSFPFRPTREIIYKVMHLEAGLQLSGCHESIWTDTWPFAHWSFWGEVASMRRAFSSFTWRLKDI